MAAGITGHDPIEAFVALADRSAKIGIATYKGARIVGRRHTAIGPLAEFLEAGWHPLPGSDQPDFGFHVMP